jgi:hypothetical protein
MVMHETKKALDENRTTTANSRFAKAGVSCFYYSDMLF